MRIFAGTSGFSYSPWKGPFYPPKLPSEDMLAFYASKLPAVEINNTFYRMPKPEALVTWREQTPKDFRFVIKAPKRITHVARLLDAGQEVERLASVASVLGDQLGPVLFQLPPFLKVETTRLRDFLAELTRVAPLLKAAFEFRHASWFCDEVYAALTSHDAALCVADDEKLSTPMVATASWGYLRLRREDYSHDDVQRWFAQTKAQPWSDTYVFFKHEDAGLGPGLATSFLAMAAQERTSASGQPPVV